MPEYKPRPLQYPTQGELALQRSIVTLLDAVGALQSWAQVEGIEPPAPESITAAITGKFLSLTGGTVTGPTVFQGGENAQGDTSAAGVIIDNFTPALWLMDRSSGAYGYMLQANGNVGLIHQVPRGGGAGVEVMRFQPGELSINREGDVAWPNLVLSDQDPTTGSGIEFRPLGAARNRGWNISSRGLNAATCQFRWNNNLTLTVAGEVSGGSIFVGPSIYDGGASSRDGMQLTNSGIGFQRTSADTNAGGARIAYYWGTTYSFKMNTNGNIQNANNSYGSLSDARMKKDIADLAPQLEDLLKLRPVSYVKTDDPEQRRQAGLIAQEVQQVKPGLVEEPDPETGMLSVKYSVLVPLMLKALQEQNARIDALEARIAAHEPS